MAQATRQTGASASSGGLSLEQLKMLPPDTKLVKTVGELVQLIEDERERAMTGGELTWIGTSEAVGHFDDMKRRTLRRRAKRWKKMQDEGRRPPVRVTKKTDSRNSDWQFCKEDCRRQGDDAEASAESLSPGELPSAPNGKSNSAGDEDSDDKSVDLGGLEDELPI